MSVIINTNTAATYAAANLSASNNLLQKSLARLSSGSKIVNPADDAGGLAVSMRLQAAIRRTDAVNTNVANAGSFLQTQDGSMKTVASVLERVGELKVLASDPTKSPDDVANYELEFTALKSELGALSSAKFNDIDLFGGTQLAVVTSEDGTQSLDIDQPDLAAAVTTVSTALSLGTLTIDDVKTATTNVATFRAGNGAQASRLGFAAEMLSANRTNLEAANSRIVDVDVAAESTRLARNNIMVQAGSAMLAQANASSQIALRLLQG